MMTETAEPPIKSCEWQPIETAPKDGTVVLVFCPERETIIAASWDGVEILSWNQHESDHQKQTRGMWRTTFGRWALYRSEDPLAEPGSQPTHWMKLPEPPK